MAKRSAGTLDRTITIQRFTSTINEFNEQIQAWADFITIRAARRDVSDGEKYAAGQVGSSLSSRFVVRSSAKARTITPTDRLVHDGASYAIHGVKEADEGRRRFIEISAVKDGD